MLDAVSHKKIKMVAFKNDVTMSQIVRVLIEKAPQIIKTRNRREVAFDAYNDAKNTVRQKVYISEDTEEKLKNMRMKNDASVGEIIRQLITNTDLNKFKFKTRGEVIRVAKGKGKK
jgi:hypothetical protein